MRISGRSISALTLAGLAATTALSIAPAMPAAAQSAAVPKIAFTERTLGNGLKVIAIRDTSTPNVLVSMWYEVGSKNDPEGRSGFAHLFEHILSRKTVNMPYNEINRMVDNVGGERNASTWYDRTNYYETVPAQYLERMLWTHAERMARPVVDKEVFETERNVVKEELRQRVLAPPYGRLFTFAIGENVYNVLPHRRPTIGSISDLDNATLEDARAFHEAYYGPDTATLIVSGNFEPAELNRLVDRYFAGIPARKTKHPLTIKAKDRPIVTRTVTATAPNVPLPVVGAAYQMPGYSHADFAALEVMDAILGTGKHSRLDTALVKTGAAAQVTTNLISTEEQSYFALGGFVASGREPEAVATDLDAAIDSLRASGPTAEEVAEAKNELLTAALQERETAPGRAFELGEALVRTGDPQHADKRLAALAKVTAADVRRVAQTYLDPRKRIVLRYKQGSGEAKDWANPTPLPTFFTPPPATRAPLALLPEGERQAPPAPGREAAISLPQPAESRLANGMRLVAARTGQVPLATLSVVMRGGSSVDPRAKAGRSALAAGIADKGTTTRSADEIAVGLEQLGATLSQNSLQDGTVLSVTAPATTLNAAAAILSDIVRNATYPEAEFQRERKRTLDGLSVALKDPGQLASMLTSPVAYGSAPYGNVATPTSVAGLTRADLDEYRRTWWRPELATVVVSGGIDPAAAKTIAEQNFGTWSASGAAPSLPDELAGATAPGRTVVVDLPGAGQAAVYAVARGLERSDSTFYNAQIANSVLGGSSTARLFNEIRVKRALSYGAYSGLTSARDEGLLLASSQTKNESAAEVAKVFLDELARIASEPLDAELVRNRQTYLAGSFQRDMETSSGFNGAIASGLLRGIEPKDVLAYTANIRQTNGPAATAAIARLLKPDSVSLVIVGDSAKFIDALKAIRPNVEVIPADKLDIAAAKPAGA
ncbi:MAG TPA: pitrilysin family protein [Sphingomicrobium sp.]